jgi:1,4-dihydroxy-2-naphthoyl-CoA hydrolase
MSIWYHKNISLESLPGGKGTMAEALDIRWKEIGEDFISATMPVDHRTIQPYGLLHGGASCVLAETVGSVASAMAIDHEKFYCVGIEINANHVRSAKSGFVTGTARPIHLGRRTHVWDIRIEDDQQRLICVSRLTVAIISRENSIPDGR